MQTTEKKYLTRSETISTKWFKQTQRVNTPLGTAKIKRKRLNPEYSTKLEKRFEGLDIKVVSQSIVKVEYIETDTIIRGDKIARYRGKTIDVINDNLETETRQVNSVSGRSKPVQNKKAVSELRRKRADNTTNYGVSRSKAYHKAKHN